MSFKNFKLFPKDYSSQNRVWRVTGNVPSRANWSALYRLISYCTSIKHNHNNELSRITRSRKVQLTFQKKQHIIFFNIVRKVVSEVKNIYNIKTFIYTLFKYSPPTPKHLCIRINQLSKHLKDVSCVRSKNNRRNSSTTVSAVLNFRPRILFFTVENKKEVAWS